MLVTLAAAVTLGSADKAGTSVETHGGVVVCDEPIAARIGADILKKGGNAVDSAVAVAFALAVVEPSAGNIGGGGFMLVRTAADGQSRFLDYREGASRHASRDMYLGPDGNVRPNASTLGPLAAGVPGTVAGMAEANRRYGRLRWKELLEPACRLARDGFPISAVQAGGLRRDRARLGQFPTTQHVYLRDGSPYASGETVKLPELADTLERIRDEGARGFYQGKTARLIAAHMRSHGGILDEQDLKDYRVRVFAPLVGTFCGYEVITPPPPSSGGIALIEMLNILEDAPAEDAAGRIHRLVEAMKFAFADRSEFLGDPEFVRVPVEKLTSKAYAALLRARIAENDIPSAQIRPGANLDGESRETTHFSVIDADGDAVANTYTLNGSFGAGDVVEGAGFLLNNEMDDFAAKPGTANMFGLIQGERNAVGPHRRPLSSMTPTIVVRNGKVEMILGSPGGPTIINTVLEVFLNRSTVGMSPLEAVQAPRLHHQWLPDVLEAEALPADVERDLRARGHEIRIGGRQGTANSIFVDPATGVRTGVADERYRGADAVATDN